MKPRTYRRVAAGNASQISVQHGLQQDSDFGNSWPAVLGTLLDET
jgi:hypothetical protein